MANPEISITQYLNDLKQGIDLLRTHFYCIEREFSHAFQSLEKRPMHVGFAEVDLLDQLLSRYWQRRTDPVFLDRLGTEASELAEFDLGSARLKQLRGWLNEMARHEHDDQIGDCFATWQQTTKAFQAYIESESTFFDTAMRSIDTTLKTGRGSSSAHTFHTDR